MPPRSADSTSSKSPFAVRGRDGRTRVSRAAARALGLPDAVISRLALCGLGIVRLQPQVVSPVLRVTSTSFLRSRELIGR